MSEPLTPEQMERLNDLLRGLNLGHWFHQVEGMMVRIYPRDRDAIAAALARIAALESERERLMDRERRAVDAFNSMLYERNMAKGDNDLLREEIELAKQRIAALERENAELRKQCERWQMAVGNTLENAEELARDLWEKDKVKPC